eukprot:5456776-Amphidinium_carterae.1
MAFTMHPPLDWSKTLATHGGRWYRFVLAAVLCRGLGHDASQGPAGPAGTYIFFTAGIGPLNKTLKHMLFNV